MSAPVVVIVNPSSQGGALGRKWNDVQRTLRRELGSFEAVMTHAPGDAPKLCREALRNGADIVAAIGGDGTIHEVSNGFFDEKGQPVRPGAALGILPYGTGGDFRKTTGTPKDLVDAARVLKEGKRRSIDMGRLEYRKGGPDGAPAACMFINIASFGIGGLVDQIVNSSKKRLGGKATFLLATARAAFRYRNKRVRLVYDGDEKDAQELTINNVAVANGRYFGGGMFIAPQAELDDGAFEIVSIGDMGTMELLMNSRRVYSGNHIGLPKVTCRRAREVVATPVDPGDEVLLDVDGEAPGSLPARFTVVPRALDVVVPSA